MTQSRPVALVTGATRGIGRELVAVLGRTYHVLVGGRDEAAVGRVVDTLPSAAGFVADLADGVETARAAAGLDRLDLLVHCAGILPPSDSELREAWRRVLEVNVVAVAHLTELALPHLREARGQVVFVNSGAGLSAGRDTSGYSASKFALTSYADAVREAERGRVRVTSVHPGRVDTDMQRDLQARFGRPYDAAEHLPVVAVVAAVMAAIDAPAGAVMDCVVIRPSGGPVR